MKHFLARRNAINQAKIDVTVHGVRGTVDTVTLTPRQFSAVLNLIDARIKEINEKVAEHPSLHTKPTHITEERDAWIEIMATIDI